jgi:hypothetical protein
MRLGKIAPFWGARKPLIQRYFLGVFRSAKMAPANLRMEAAASWSAQAID